MSVANDAVISRLANIHLKAYDDRTNRAARLHICMVNMNYKRAFALVKWLLELNNAQIDFQLKYRKWKSRKKRGIWITLKGKLQSRCRLSQRRLLVMQVQYSSSCMIRHNWGPATWKDLVSFLCFNGFSIACEFCGWNCVLTSSFSFGSAPTCSVSSAGRRHDPPPLPPPRSEVTFACIAQAQRAYV